MKVEMANNISFCGGVKWAIDEVFKIKKRTKKKIYVFGELIHNKQFNAKLSSEGIYIADTINECSGKIVVIRSHGVAPNIEKRLRDVALEVVDLTCPIVKKIQMMVKEYTEKKYHVIICGNPKHPEVIGLSGYSDNYKVLEYPEEAQKINLDHKSVLVSQTTYSEKKFKRIKEILLNRNKDILIENTLCSATKTRQKEAEYLAEKSDVLLVIGGKHSSNTKKLAETAMNSMKGKVFHIETSKELKNIKFESNFSVGIISGASTPAWIIDEVYEELMKIEKE